MFHYKDVLKQVWPLCLILTSRAREPCLSRITQNSVCSRFEFGYLSPVFLKIYSFSVSMVRRRISEAQRWQIIGMHTTGMSFKAIGRQMGYHYTVVSRLVSCNNVAPVTNLCLGRATTRSHSSQLMEQKKSCCWNIKTHYLRFKHFIITITDDPSPC